MTKGPVPKKAIDVAMPIAWARGFVILCERHRGSIASFIIAGPGWTAIVYLGRTKRLNELPGNINVQFSYGLAGLRRVPPAPGRSCEIWACDYYGNLRFFRLTVNGVIEIDVQGRVAGQGPGIGEIPLPPSDGEKVPG